MDKPFWAEKFHAAQANFAQITTRFAWPHRNETHRSGKPDRCVFEVFWFLLKWLPVFSARRLARFRQSR
jgi:hypothetical protein